MDDVREATDEFLADRPEAEPALEAILTVDEDGPWTFDDLDIDSGTFGEIVSRDIVENGDDGYQVVDRAAVRAALDGETVAVDNETTGFDVSAITRPDIDRQTVLVVGGALAVVALVRIVFMWSSVFRGSDIVLAGNDPYYYRYWVDTLLQSELQAFDVGSLASLPERVAISDVLLIVGLWWSASLLGGGQTASGLVVAWYPVVAAVVSAALVYLLAVVVTSDRRIGIAATLLLATIPAHGYRSALGFGDHHAFDFVWLALLVLSLSVLFNSRDANSWDRWQTRSAVLAFGISIVGQITAWRGGPILLLPVGICVLLFVLSTLRAERSPLVDSQWFLSGMVLGAIGTGLLHTVFGWVELYRAVAPLLLAVGAVVLVGAGELWHRLDRSPTEFVSVTMLLGVAGVAGIWSASSELRQPIELLVGFLSASKNIAETQPLFSTDLGLFISPVLIFGFALFLSLPYVALTAWRLRREHQPEWIPAVTFASCLFVLSVVQLRFSGELSLFVAIFSGIGFVDLGERVDLLSAVDVFGDTTRTLSVPDTRTVGLLLFLFVLIAGIGMVQTGVKQQQLTHDQQSVDTATWLGEYAAHSEQSESESYVLTDWGTSRFYNYHVSGSSRSYSYALTTYSEFLRAQDPRDWYEQLRDDVAFVVVESSRNGFGAGSMQQRLASTLESTSTDSLRNYRLVYLSPDRGQRVYELVEGATITGVGPANSSVEIRSETNLSTTQYTYQRQFTTTQTGWYTVDVSQPGTYRIGEERITVSATDVRDGATRPTVPTNGSFYWSFDEGTGETAYELFGANHGRIHESQRVPGVERDGLQFDPERNSTVSATLRDGGPQEFTVSVWVRPTALDTGPTNEPRQLVRTDRANMLLIEETGTVSFRVPGVSSENFRTGTVPLNEWTHVAATYNGTHRSVYLDGERVGTDRIGSGNVSWDERILIGGASRDTGSFEGTLDEVRIYDHVLDGGQLRSYCNRSSGARC